MEELGSYRTHFHEFLYFNMRRISVNKVYFSLNFDKNILREDLYTCLIISSSVPLRMRNVSDKLAEKIKTHILGSITFL